jgi:hypothetical protein
MKNKTLIAIALVGLFPFTALASGKYLGDIDECPHQDALMSKIFASTLNEGNMNCVSLSEERLTVPVRLFFSEGYVDENWEIIHRTGESDNGVSYQQVALDRPNGMPVIPTSY